MSNATGRSVLGQPNVDKRRSAFEATNRSAFEATKFSTSTDKADDDLESEFMNRFGLYCTNFFITHLGYSLNDIVKIQLLPLRGGYTLLHRLSSQRVILYRRPLQHLWLLLDMHQEQILFTTNSHFLSNCQC